MVIFLKTTRTLFVVACSLMLTTTVALAQSSTINFSEQSLSTGKLMAEIESQSSYKFGFEKSALNIDRIVTLPGRQTTLTDALDCLAASSNFSYMVRGSVIVLAPKPAEPRPEPKPRTSDQYTPSDPKALNVWDDRPATGNVEVQEVIAPEPLATMQYPASYSAYDTPNIYSQIENKLPILAVKTNLLYGGAALTPNLAGEIGLGKHTSLELGGSWNRFNRIGTLDDNKKLNHWIIRPEFRYWMCERFNGHFFGLHAMYSKYNISNYEIPLLFDKQYRYQGKAYGAGITYGYHLPLAKRWGVEFHVGAGVVQLDYNKYDCTLCSDKIESKSKTYVGPTRAGISLVFMIK